MANATLLPRKIDVAHNRKFPKQMIPPNHSGLGHDFVSKHIETNGQMPFQEAKLEAPSMYKTNVEKIPTKCVPVWYKTPMPYFRILEVPLNIDIYGDRGIPHS